MGEALIFLGILIFLAHLFSMIFSRKKIPDVLLLMIIGIIIGPLLGLISPTFMGQAGSIFTTIVLVVILFDAGTDISIHDLKNAWKPTITLSISSLIGSIILVTIVSYALGLSLISSIIVGVILSGTSSAVVIPLTQHLKLSKDSKTALVLESAITDIICFVLTLALLESAIAGKGVDFGSIAGGVISSFVMAIIIGFVSAIVWSSLLHKIRTFKNSMFLTPAFVFVIYGISESLGFSGAISALAVGITITNMEFFNFKFIEKYQKGKHLTQTENERAFISEIVFILKTFFFVYIGISIPFNNIIALIGGLVATLILLGMRIFVAKYFSPKSSNGYDKSIIALMIPKGLAAAVLASMPEQMGLAEGGMIKSVVYAAVLFSILLCSVLIFVIGRYPKANVLLRIFFNTKKKSNTSALSNEKATFELKEIENKEE
ncbi:MAG: cation:proton antiporter [Bacteroidales bacterium]|nr:cation:proton antiporter [Bacteroidales bacterium]MDD4528895.1 cation:proton antiporter [Bacteroidales bacterium]MDD4829318.1 cation:proton antiporter [Bacteroidales bacterium]